MYTAYKRAARPTRPAPAAASRPPVTCATPACETEDEAALEAALVIEEARELPEAVTLEAAEEAALDAEPAAELLD